MCTSIIEIARAEGMAKRGDEWFPLSQAVVAYDHARHAPLGDVITLDFINTGLEPGARAGIELTLETAKELRAALDRAIAAAEFEETEVRGKGAAPRRVRAASHARGGGRGRRQVVTNRYSLSGGYGLTSGCFCAKSESQHNLAEVRFVPTRDSNTTCYSITSSALASSDVGTVRPSALAVLRLIVNSNFVGCTTGSSAGFSPFRIRPT
jgi:hypothetical protein